MEQRRLRLGDTLDDYCPRERRLTNHAVVAMIEEDVKQTRCTTCDAEHPYKGGKVPRRRKKETTGALYKEVLAGQLSPDASPVARDVDSDVADSPDVPSIVIAPVAGETIAAPVEARDPDRIEHAAQPERLEPGDIKADSVKDIPSDEPLVEVEEGPVHRPLIRAQLPRIEGHKEERRPAEFTIRQRSGSGHFRGADTRMKPHRPGGHGGSGAGNGGNANRGHGGPRFAGPRPPGSGSRGPAGRGGPAAGFRAGPPRPGGGRKRSR
jgi:hypothetical protein